MYVENCSSFLDKGAGCKSSVLEVAWAQQISCSCTCMQSPWQQEAVWERSRWSLPETWYKVLGEGAFALQRWSQDCLLAEVGLVGITLVAGQRDGFTTYPVLLLGRKARAGDQGPGSGSLLCPYRWTQQWLWRVDATGQLVFIGGLIRLCYFETPAPSCTDPSSWPLL